MIALLLNETLELTYYTAKLLVNCAYSTYKYFRPEPDMLMIEMQDLKTRITILEKQQTHISS